MTVIQPLAVIYLLYTISFFLMICMSLMMLLTFAGCSKSSKGLDDIISLKGLQLMGIH